MRIKTIRFALIIAFCKLFLCNNGLADTKNAEGILNFTSVEFQKLNDLHITTSLRLSKPTIKVIKECRGGILTSKGVWYKQNKSTSNNHFDFEKRFEKTIVPLDDFMKLNTFLNNPYNASLYYATLNRHKRSKTPLNSKDFVTLLYEQSQLFVQLEKNPFIDISIKNELKLNLGEDVLRALSANNNELNEKIINLKTNNNTENEATNILKKSMQMAIKRDNNFREFQYKPITLKLKKEKLWTRILAPKRIIDRQKIDFSLYQAPDSTIIKVPKNVNKHVISSEGINKILLKGMNSSKATVK